MPDHNHRHFAHTLALLGASNGSLTALSRRLGLPEATVRRWSTGAHLPPPSAWLGLRAALEAAGLGEDVADLGDALLADLRAAYGLPSRWVCLCCRDVVTIEEDIICADCGSEPIEAPTVRAVDELLAVADRLALLCGSAGGGR